MNFFRGVADFMKIVLLTNEAPPHIYGGAGVHVDFLSRELARLEGKRHFIQVLCFGDQEELEGNRSIRGVREGCSFPSRTPAIKKSSIPSLRISLWPDH